MFAELIGRQVARHHAVWMIPGSDALEDMDVQRKDDADQTHDRHLPTNCLPPTMSTLAPSHFASDHRYCDGYIDL